MLARVALLTAQSGKPFWPRVSLNRIVQRSSASTVDTDRAYFERIPVMDVFDRAGALGHFLRIWEFAFEFAGANHAPGTVFDSEEYNWGIAKSPIRIARANGKSVAQTIDALRGIGRDLADIAERTYPRARILALFTRLDKRRASSVSDSGTYIYEGILLRAKERNMKLLLIDGGEEALGYVNPSPEALRAKITKSLTSYDRWLREYPDHFALGGTITVWNDAAKLRGWVKRHAGPSPRFHTLGDFEPMLLELFRHYGYVWIYVPSVTDHDPIGATADLYSRKLAAMFNRVRAECRDRRPNSAR